MAHSPEANWFAASQEIPRILWNTKVHYRTHKRPPPVPILGQPNPVQIPTSHLLEIHPNIIRPSTPRSPQWSLSLRFPHQGPIRPPLLTHTRHMPSPSHFSRFYHPHNIGFKVTYCRFIRCSFYLRTIWNVITSCQGELQVILFYLTPLIFLQNTRKGISSIFCVTLSMSRFYGPQNINTLV